MYYIFDVKFIMRSIIESPFAGDVERNRLYAQLSMRIALSEHNESPLAFHTIYTQCLSDADPAHRKMGIERSFPWYEVADKVVYMIDRGISTGMHDGFITAKEKGKEVEFRTASTSPEIIAEVRRWHCIDQAEKALELMQKKVECEPHFYKKGDITPFALERRSEIQTIKLINQADFVSPKRDRSESILER